MNNKMLRKLTHIEMLKSFSFFRIGAHFAND
jgi:hypothetical protein